MSSRFLFALAAVALAGCDREGTDLLPDNSKFPSVVTIGELRLMNFEDYWNFRVSSDPQEWCADSADDNGYQSCYYGQLGMPEAGIRGGSSYTFTIPTVVAPEGSDNAGEVQELESVCVMVDPETVFWNHSVAQLERETKPLYADFHDDDGDLDLFVGMSSYYTGSPGVELGDFKGYYTDSLGRTISIEYGECVQRGQTLGEHHSGRGHLEYCEINVEGRTGIQFTVVMESFSVPLNDGALGYGTLVYAGSCSDIVTSPREELVIPEESMVPEPSDEPNFATMACTKELELAVGADVQQGFCCVHPGLCNERVDDDVCEGFNETYDPDTREFLNAAANYCAYTAVEELPGGTSYEEISDNGGTNGLTSNRSICCADYSVVPPGEALDAAPVVPDDLADLPEESLPPEYRIPYIAVQDFPRL